MIETDPAAPYYTLVRATTIRSTYKLRMSVNPANGHETLSNLALKHFNFIIHRALILFASLCGHNQGSNNKLTVTLLARQNRASFNLR